MPTESDIPNIHEEVANLPPDIRQDIAERGKNDLYFFAKGILGYADLTPTCHGPLCVFLDHNASRFKLVLMPRGHFKTSLCTISRVAQKVVCNPNERILLLNETSENAEAFLSAVREHFETNRVLRTLYSNVVPKNYRETAWNNKELKFVRDWKGPQATVEAKGMTSALTSNHYTHITIDDPISEEATKSAAVMEDAIRRIDKVISLMAAPEKDTFDLIGTRWALYDVYSVFMRNYGPRLTRFIRGAIKDGDPIFPELISLESLAQARTNMGEYAFSCLYMNNPRDIANQDFNIDDLKFWRWSTDEEGIVLYDRSGDIEEQWPMGSLDICVSVDLAVSERVTSDRNAVVTCGITPNGKAVVLDVWARRCTPLDVIEKLFALKRRFSPRVFGIEGVAYQKAFKYFLRQEAENRGEYLNIIELKAVPSRKGTGNNTKEMRIRGLQPVCATGKLYILPTHHDLRNEMADFPLGEHDDVMDALAHQLTMWRGVMSQDRWKKYKASEEMVVQAVQREMAGLSSTGDDYDPDFDAPPRYAPWKDFTIA